MATKFELEEELYYGGCLEMILGLLGNNRERKFICEGSDSQAKKHLEWGRLLKFLKVELSQQEKIILFNKSKKCLGMVPVCDTPSYKKVNKD